MNIIKSPSRIEAGSYQDLQRENNVLKARIAELERLVISDSLTPVYNRRHFADQLDRWCARAHRYGGSYGLLFIDVDDLKGVNDKYGHGTGDAMLIGIAQCLLDNVRKSDMVARIGGDEFAILLDTIPQTELSGKAHHLARAVSRLSITHNGNIVIPSISVGHSVIETGVKASEIMQRADRSMYADKNMKDLV